MASCKWAAYAVMPDGTPLRDVGFVATHDNYIERRAVAVNVLGALSATVDGIAALGAEFDAQPPEILQIAADATQATQRLETELARLPEGPLALQGWDLSWRNEIEAAAVIAEQAACVLEKLHDAGFAVQLPHGWDLSQPPPKAPPSLGEQIAEAGSGFGRGLLLLAAVFLLSGRGRK